MEHNIPYGRQDIQQQDIDAVVDVLHSDWLTQGPAVPRFENAVAKYAGAKYAVAVNSATSALHIACLALDLTEGDSLWTVPNTFVASANCGRFCGAVVDFVDIDPLTLNMSVSALSAKLQRAEQNGSLPKVIIPVHFAGQPCQMQEIAELIQPYGIRIIEDASHAIGARYKSETVGNCRFSDITVFSFHPVKIITTAEGGMAMTNNSELAEKMVRLRSHGITRDPAQMVGQSQGGWDYQQLELGFNYRMTDMQAALGYSQLQRLDSFIVARAERVAIYEQQLQNMPLQRQSILDEMVSAHHLYPVQLLQSAGIERRALFDAMRNAGVGVNVHYIPVHTQPYYQQLGFRTGDYPVAESYYRNAISLPMFATLTLQQQLHVTELLQQLL